MFCCSCTKESLWLINARSKNLTQRLHLSHAGGPHITQLVSESYYPLCYDINGDDGATYKVLEEPNIGSKCPQQI